jgi:hypothetical protein
LTEQESGGILRIPEESGVNTGIPVPQEFLRKIPVKAKKKQGFLRPLQNHVPVKNSTRKRRKNRNPQESCQEQWFGPKK